MVELDEKFCDVIMNRFIAQIGSNRDVYLVRDGQKIPYTEIPTDQQK